MDMTSPILVADNNLGSLYSPKAFSDPDIYRKVLQGMVYKKKLKKYYWGGKKLQSKSEVVLQAYANIDHPNRVFGIFC